MATALSNTPDWSLAADRLLGALQQGGVLHWTPYNGFVLQLRSGKLTKPRLYTVWQVRRAGLITTDDHDWRQPRTWRAVGRHGIAHQSRSDIGPVPPDS